MNERQQLCTFYLGDLLCGIDVCHVQEILPPQPLTPVPLAGHFVRGLINLRGQIVTAVDLRAVLHLADSTPVARSVNLIVRYGAERVSFLVDRLGEVLDVDVDRLETLPENADQAAAELILGGYKLADRLLLILETDRIVEHVSSLHETTLD
ncbi:MAG: chemotaxis protein CheW [Planctomycetes bacterium]|nr:chemotaxis protein CheW [Planctomycetota bacterium]